MPEVTLVTQPTDTAAASTALDELLAALPSTSMLAGVKLYRTVIGGQFVVSTTQQGIDDFRGGGAKLSADPSFLAARRSSRACATETTGFVYVEREGRAAAARALAGVKLPAGLPKLGTFMAYGGTDGPSRRSPPSSACRQLAWPPCRIAHSPSRPSRSPRAIRTRSPTRSRTPCSTPCSPTTRWAASPARR